MYENIFGDKHVLVAQPKEQVLELREDRLRSDDLRIILKAAAAESAREEHYVRVVRFKSRWKRFGPLEGWHLAIQGAVYIATPFSSYYKVPATQRAGLLNLLREIDKYAERDIILQHAGRGRCDRAALPNQDSLNALLQFIQMAEFPKEIKDQLGSFRALRAIEDVRLLGVTHQKGLIDLWGEMIYAWKEQGGF